MDDRLPHHTTENCAMNAPQLYEYELAAAISIRAEKKRFASQPNPRHKNKTALPEEKYTKQHKKQNKTSGKNIH